MRNTVTGELFKVVFAASGQRLIYHVGRNVPQPSEVGNLAESGYQGTSTAYSIRNGRIVTYVADTPFEVTVYKMGDHYIAARSNEFGYANYEMMARAPDTLVKLAKGH
jgi:hypothetical protein